MQVKQLKQDGLLHELEITIHADEIDNRINIRLKEVSKTVRLPGFRPAKCLCLCSRKNTDAPSWAIFWNPP
jgi:FKBP-type peptidyl-prolyl cis-trans isomerase (trigger factor)